MEKPVYFSNVGVVKKRLYFQFSDELGEEVLFYYSLFLDHFESNDETCAFLDC